MQLSWDEVSGANSYKIFAADDPYSGYTEISSGISGLTWISDITGIEKKFYYVVASTETAREGVTKSRFIGSNNINSKISQKTKTPKTNFKKSDVPKKKIKMSKLKN